MEADWVAKRSMLRHLITLHPTWTPTDLATCLGHSESWVKKWRHRFKATAPDDQQVLQSRSRARQTPPPSTPPEVVQRILDLRDQPGESPAGARAASVALLPAAPSRGVAEGVRLPRSTKTIWQILRRHDRIAVDRRRTSKPLERPAPLQERRMRSISKMPAVCLLDPLGKRQHGVETCKFVDAGTSIWLHALAREDFTAETAFETVVEFVQLYGLPAMLTFDCDPRWVGGARARLSLRLCALLALPGNPAQYLPAASPRQELLRRATASHLQVRVLAGGQAKPSVNTHFGTPGDS